MTKTNENRASAGKGRAIPAKSGKGDIPLPPEPAPRHNFWICPVCKTKKSKRASKYSLYYSIMRGRMIYSCYKCYLHEKRSREKQC